MGKIFWYFLAVVVGLLGALSLFRGVELLADGQLSAYGAGRVFGSFVLGPILLYAARKALVRARQPNVVMQKGN